MAEELSIVVKARDDASRSLQGINGRLQQMSKQLRMVGMGMTIVGGAITAALGMSIKSFAKAGDEVQKMALRTGFATETLSELRHVLELTGGSLGLMDKATKTMSKAISDADEGLTTYLRVFERLGLSIDELKMMKPEDQFWEIAFAIANLEDHYLKTATAAEIFGRAGTQFLPMLSMSRDEIEALREEAHKLGIVFDQEAADKAAEFNDALLRLRESVSGLKFQIGEVLAPVISNLADRLTEVIARVREWGEQHPWLYEKIVTITGAMGLLMIPMGMFLMILPMIVKGVAMLVGFFVTRLIPGILAVTRMLWLKIAAWLQLWIAMGPKGWAIIAGIAAGFALLAIKLREYTVQVEGSIQSTLALTGGLEEQGTALNIVGNQWEDYAGAIEGATGAMGGATGATVAAGGAVSGVSDQYKRMEFHADVAVKKLEEHAAGIRELTDKQIAYYKRNIEKFQDLQKAFPTTPTGLEVSRPGGGGGGVRYPYRPYGPRAPRPPTTLPQKTYGGRFYGSPSYSFQFGGIMPFTGLAHLEKGETVLPTQGGRSPLQTIIHVYLDGEEVTKTVVDRIATQARLEGAF